MVVYWGAVVILKFQEKNGEKKVFFVGFFRISQKV